MTTPRPTSPSFDYIDDQQATPTWPQSQLWDRTYDEARFNDQSKLHRDDSVWLFSELHATRRRMHQSWSDNHQLSSRLGAAANLQKALDESNHTIIDLKRAQQAAVRESSECRAEAARMRARCEGLLITNERLEEFQMQAKTTESKWIGGLAECESYMKELCGRLEETTRARDHYKKWATDRTDQLREAEETLSNMLIELQSTVQDRDSLQQECMRLKQRGDDLNQKLKAAVQNAHDEAEKNREVSEKQLENLLKLKMELSTSKTNNLTLQSEKEELKNQLLILDGSLREAREQLTSSQSECLELRGRYQTSELELKKTTELAVQLDTKLIKAREENEKGKIKSKEKKEHINMLEKDLNEIRMKLEQMNWQVQVVRMETERMEATHQQEKDKYENEIFHHQECHLRMTRALEVARAGAEAKDVARVARAVAASEMASEAMYQQPLTTPYQQQQQQQQQQQSSIPSLLSSSIDAVGETLLGPVSASASEVSFELGPLGSSRSVVGVNRGTSVTRQRRSVLSRGIVASLEQNVVDYALMSLQRAGPIVEKNKYKVGAMST